MGAPEVTEAGCTLAAVIRLMGEMSIDMLLRLLKGYLLPMLRAFRAIDLAALMTVTFAW